MRFRYLLWDFDGTLFDTYPPLIRAMAGALAALGHTIPEARISALLADSLVSAIDTLSAGLALDRAAFVAEIERIQADISPNERPPFPGVIALCERVRAAGGTNLLFTHRDRATLCALLSWHGADHLFLDILTTDDGYPRKPDPAGFRALIERNGLPVHEVLAIGDRDLDILAGQAAGIATCLFRATPSPGVTPDFRIASWDELAALIGLPAAPGAAFDTNPDTDSDTDLTRR